MVSLSEESKQRRREFIQHIFDKIRNVPKYSSFCSHTFYVIASLGLQLKAKEERLFEDEDWNNLECREELLKIILEFLKKHIR